MIKVRLLFFASLEERFGCSQQTQEMPKGCTVTDLLFRLFPDPAEQKEYHSYLRVAVNEEIATFDTVLTDNDRVAFLMPVAGG